MSAAPIAAENHVHFYIGVPAQSGLVVLSLSFVVRDPKQTCTKFADNNSMMRSEVGAATSIATGGGSVW
jgi:hypothetical protein